MHPARITRFATPASTSGLRRYSRTPSCSRRPEIVVEPAEIVRTRSVDDVKHLVERVRTLSHLLSRARSISKLSDRARIVCVIVDRAMPISLPPDRVKRLVAYAGVPSRDLDDVVQEAMLRLWEKREQARSVRNAIAWAESVVLNTARDHQRGARRRDAALTSLEDAGLVDRHPSPEARAIARQKVELAWMLIGQIDERFRATFIACEVLERSVEEVAGEQEIPLGGGRAARRPRRSGKCRGAGARRTRGGRQRDRDPRRRFRGAWPACDTALDRQRPRKGARRPCESSGRLGGRRVPRPSAPPAGGAWEELPAWTYGRGARGAARADPVSRAP
ncbi:RNA polymerase sigma factor [Sorangium sp. So ce1389]|uniref:RNA polymerase sigma factor n=1 Tax=Sorangium sp. So ce1389 TaxID=3133336 RepID=UPI003F6279AD